jgi:hypothetical protein
MHILLARNHISNWRGNRKLRRPSYLTGLPKFKLMLFFFNVNLNVI